MFQSIAVINCLEPSTENFMGNVEYTNTTYGSLATYTCPGNCSYGTSICGGNGTWSNHKLTCFSKKTPSTTIAQYLLFITVCKPLESPRSGTVALSNSLYPGSTATMTCNDGYVISDNTNTLHCTCEGWSRTTPTCDGMQDNQYVLSY